MNLVNYIIYFLKDFSYITVPSLGYFELEIISAEVKDTGEIYPPSCRVLFSQQHDLNNDSIVKLIANFEKRSQEEVRKELQKKVIDWKNVMKEQEKLILPGLGIFFQDKEKITFEMNKDCIFNFRNFGLPNL